MTTILFDLDGTLTDPKEGITTCVQYALAALGVSVANRDALTPFIGPPLHRQFMDFCGWDEATANRAVEAYRRRFSTVGKFENKVYPGIEELLRQLCAQGKRLAVATSKPEVFAREILEHFRLAQYFTVVVGSELDGTRVEKAQVVREALHRLNLRPTERSGAVMVGDRAFDVLAAQAHGLVSVAVAYGYAQPGELEHASPDHIASSVAELTALLCAME